MKWSKIALAASTLILAAAPALALAKPMPINYVRWRNIGPALPEGRATAVVGSNKNPLLFYAGTAGGVFTITFAAQ